MRKAVVIGINNYPQGAALYGCIADATAFGKLIEKHGDGGRNFYVETHTDVPTKNELTEIVYNLFRSKHEISLLYFSGHGTVNDLDTYLVTPDFQGFDPGLSLSHVLQMANNCQSDNRIIILDCCHSGAAGSPVAMGGTAAVLHNGVTILAASKEDESAVEVNGKGVFTSLLCQALEGGAADICGNITPGSIYAYIDQALGAFDQRPVFKTNITAFTPLQKVAPTITKETLRKITNYFSDPLKELPLDSSYEKTNSLAVEHRVLEPYAAEPNTSAFQDLQRFESVGLVKPVGTPHMYFAAMESRSCRLTPLGLHYWRLVQENKI